jgi:hypothetical protein
VWAGTKSLDELTKLHFREFVEEGLAKRSPKFAAVGS